jgi:hypothetical protein
MCVGHDELPPGPGGVRLGELDGVPFYIDADQYERWGRPRFLIDLSPGDTGSFSLEGSLGVHFITRTQDIIKDEELTMSTVITPPQSGSFLMPALPRGTRAADGNPPRALHRRHGDRC